ncbi:S-formylglutathione hydrolase-like [Tupaia chinensis]|uniref:S-formylglutathione hydrolase-like n=1 Tax=Tupaia chinensis TaxID=246437 RepID=UPI0003C8E764|nr:S-formylglutathione hydrolase-like [Tupaia chinensis]
MVTYSQDGDRIVVLEKSAEFEKRHSVPLRLNTLSQANPAIIHLITTLPTFLLGTNDYWERMGIFQKSEASASGEYFGISSPSMRGNMETQGASKMRAYPSCFHDVVCGSQVSLKTFMGLQAQNPFHKNPETLYVFACIHSCTNSTKAVEARATGDSAQIKAVAPNLLVVIVFFTPTNSEPDAALGEAEPLENPQTKDFDSVAPSSSPQQVNTTEAVDCSRLLPASQPPNFYLPPKAETGKYPALYWLSGLTCTEQNFISKSGYYRATSEHGLSVIASDTSLRGCNIKGQDDNWDFSTGAGFYVDSTEELLKTNYRMYSYITKKLPQLINANVPVDPQRMSIFGHSMGGHGNLTCALKNPGKYKSVSAFAPICNPVLCPWGRKPFSGYLGTDQSKWKAYNATHLVKSYPGSQLDVLIDEGKDDQSLSDGQLLPDKFIAACTEKKITVVFRLQEVYDHNYYCIATFITDHNRHRARFLNA